jgi:hypothetical protein
MTPMVVLFLGITLMLSAILLRRMGVWAHKMGAFNDLLMLIGSLIVVLAGLGLIAQGRSKRERNSK